MTQEVFIVRVEPNRPLRSACLCVMLLSSAAFAFAQTGPRLQVEPREWNFGQAWTGDPCSVEVQLKNVGDEPLKILDIKSSCGCTTAEPRKRELAPGESDTITIRYDTKTKKTDVKETITLTTNDTVEPSVKIRVIGKVLNVFTCKPFQGISFGKVTASTEKTEILNLTNNMSDKVFPKLQPLPPEAPFELELIEVEAGMQYKLSAKTKPPLQLGNNHYVIKLDTGVEKLPTMDIDINAQVLNRVEIWPDRLRVTEAQTVTSSRTLYLYFDPAQRVTIKDVRSNIDGLQVKIMGEKAPDRYSVFPGYQLAITMPVFDAVPDTGGVLEILTDDSDPLYQKLTIPIEKIYAKAKKKPQPSNPLNIAP